MIIIFHMPHYVLIQNWKWFKIHKPVKCVLWDKNYKIWFYLLLENVFMTVNFYGKLFYFAFELSDYKYMTISIVRLAMTSILRSCSRRKASYAVKSAFICIYSMIVEPLLRLLAFTIDLFILFFKILTKLN